MKYKIAAVFLLVSFTANAQTSLSENTVNELKSLIPQMYKIRETNPFHSESNKEIEDLFSFLLNNCTTFDQDDLDKYAMHAFRLLYFDTSLGCLEDSPDYLRQTMRTSILYSCIAICSESNSWYYLSMASALTFRNNYFAGYPEYYEDFIPQMLVNIFIYNLKDLLFQGQTELSEYRETYRDLIINTGIGPEIDRIFSILENEIPQRNK